MAEISKERMDEGRAVFNSLIQHLRDIKLNFEEKELEDRFMVKFNMSGDDIPMRFFIYVQPAHQLIVLHSPQPVTFPADKIDLACKAACAINFRLTDGNFQVDIRDGEPLFVMATSYAGSLISSDVFNYLLGMSINIVDEFNDKLLMLAKGIMTFEQLKESLNY